jgi:quercetin dioxygenase-like cupin family protein
VVVPESLRIWEAELKRLSSIVVAATILAIVSFVHAGDAIAQQSPSSTPVRTVLAVANLPSVVQAPFFFRLSKIELNAGQSTNYSGPIGFIYLLSGALESQVNGQKRTLQPGDALVVTADKVHTFVAASAEPAIFLHYVLGRGEELDRSIERAPAIVTELYRSAESIPRLKSGPYEFTLTRVTFPPRMAPNVPHYRSGAALYYVLEGSGTFIADGKTEIRDKGMAHFEPQGWVHQWGNPGETPLVLLQANISEEGVPAVILVQ